MRVLVDTHAFLWFIRGDPRMSPSARSILDDPGNIKALSAATPWEIAIKVGLKKLALTEPFDVLIPREIVLGGFVILPLEIHHASRVATLPHHHRDPFDRLLIAQALTEGMPILSADGAFDAYGVIRIW